MKSELIEYFRFADMESGMLQAGQQYILAPQSLPAKQISTEKSQMELLDLLFDSLQYESAIPEAEKWKTITQISEWIKKIFIDVSGPGFDDCQLDVVLNASELGLLPFELLLDDKQIPLFANPERKTVFTRRIRQNNFESGFAWPKTPRMLFAYSHGGSKEVPFQEHLYELRKALSKWGGTDNDEVFTMMEEPSFEDLAKELQKKDPKKKPYTYVHILAHGKDIDTKGRKYRYETGIAFGKDSQPATDSQKIKTLFESLPVKPLMVNYMICDGANFANPMMEHKNPVLVTHKAGVPIVTGSQFPLSMEGSVLITKKLFAALFNGEDIRSVLHTVRSELFKQKEKHHDWISFVSYVRLPEGYKDYLYKAALECQMQNLRYIKNKTDYSRPEQLMSEDEFKNSRKELQDCISSLEEKLGEIENNKKYEIEALENLGLIGSALKRIAELYFFKSLKVGPLSEAEKNEQRQLLENSLSFYKRACDKNLTHHWTLVQYLSLDTVLNKKITDTGYFHTARKSINIAIDKNPDSWAYGSLVESLLLDPVPASDNKQKIEDALEKLIQKCNKEKDVFPLESSWFQVYRYRTWWVKENGYVIDDNIPANDKNLLDNILERLKLAIKDFNKS